MPGKATIGQMLVRTKEVERMLLDGEPRANILEFGTENWNVSEHSVEQYITEAYKRITAVNKATIDENRGWVLRNYLDLFKRVKGVGDVKEERACLDGIAKILGLHEETVNHNIFRIPEMSDEQIVSELSETVN